MKHIDSFRKRRVLIITVSVLVVILCFGFVVGKLAYRQHLWDKYGDSMLTMSDLLIEDFAYTSHDDIHIIEFDSQGRYLFEVDAWPYANVVYIIVQKDLQDGFVYYYEDFGALFLDNIETYLTKEEKAQLEQFKEQNDWDKPLQEEKMTKIAIDKMGE